MIENVRAEGQAHPKIEFGIPLNTEKRPLGWINGHDFKSLGNVSLGKPSAHPRQLNQFDAVIDGGIVQRKGDQWDETIDAGEGTVMRRGQIENQALFSRIFPSSHADWINAKQGKRRRAEWPDNIAFSDLRRQQPGVGVGVGSSRKEIFSHESNVWRRENAHPKTLGKPIEKVIYKHRIRMSQFRCQRIQV